MLIKVLQVAIFVLREHIHYQDHLDVHLAKMELTPLLCLQFVFRVRRVIGLETHHQLVHPVRMGNLLILNILLAFKMRKVYFP